MEMADVFISYAREDRAIARDLANYLEARGLSTWHDIELRGGDDYQLKIAKMIGESCAVIVIWTADSVKSIWVRAEAGLANNNGKLVPIKIEELKYDDIPPPFNLLHAISIDSKVDIAASIELKIATERKPHRIRQFRYEVLSWIGVAGGTITLFSNLGSVINLAYWANWLIARWKQAINIAWDHTLSWLGINLGIATRVQLTFCLFLIVSAMSSKLDDLVRLSAHDFWRAVAWKRFLVTSIVSLLWFSFVGFVVAPHWPADWPWQWLTSAWYLSLLPIMYAFVSHWPRRSAIVTALCAWVVFVLLFESYFEEIKSDATQMSPLGQWALFTTTALIALTIAQPDRFAKRLLALVLGLTALIGLNELVQIGGAFISTKGGTP
jgi:TIR domain